MSAGRAALPFVLLLVAAPLGCGQAEPDPNAMIEPSAAERASAAVPSSLSGTSWRLVRYTAFGDDVDEETPRKNEHHVITFAPDGTLKLSLACNSGTAKWSADQSGEGGSLDITALQVTAKTCRNARMQNVARDIEYVGGFVIRPGLLVLNLRADSGNLEWEPVK